MGAPVIDFEEGNAEIAAKALLLGSEAPENIAYPHLRTAFSGQEKNTMPKVSGLFTVLLGSSWLVAIVILISSGLLFTGCSGTSRFFKILLYISSHSFSYGFFR